MKLHEDEYKEERYPCLLLCQLKTTTITIVVVKGYEDLHINDEENVFNLLPTSSEGELKTTIDDSCCEYLISIVTAYDGAKNGIYIFIYFSLLNLFRYIREDRFVFPLNTYESPRNSSR